MNTINIDAYCTCSKNKLAYPLDRYFLFSLVVLILGRYPCDVKIVTKYFIEEFYKDDTTAS
jgi:hypothetical protein